MKSTVNEMLDVLVPQLKRTIKPYVDILMCDMDCGNCVAYLQEMSCDECPLCSYTNGDCRHCKTIRMMRWNRIMSEEIIEYNGTGEKIRE